MSHTETSMASFEVMKKYAENFERVLNNHGLKDEAKEFMYPFNELGAAYSDLMIDPTWSDQILQDLENAATGYRGMKGKIQGYRALMTSPNKAVATSVESLYNALIKYLVDQAIDGWIYRFNDKDQTVEPYLIYSVFFMQERIYGRGRDKHREPPYVRMVLKANSADCGEHSSYRGVEERSVSFHEEDLGKTIPEILYDKGYQKENSQLKADYEAILKRFQEFQPMHSEQFWARGKVWPSERYDRYGSRHTDMWSLGDQPVKVVNDETMLHRRFTLHSNPRFWREYGVKKNFDSIPIHTYIFCFDLERHDNCWIHVLNLEKYEYDLTLRKKIVLPDDHRDLVEILTTDVDVFQEVGDVIKGKSGGTAILCMGKPGLGKTLTAEIYGEVRQRPLYKVHSGQLGVKGEEVESRLKLVLSRAERWNAVMLIDEADVFIRKRGDDINHNAIVAAFLRTLEYFHGLLFLTTNREEDVDDAILSRMIAIFRYEQPTQEEAAAIWKIMAEEFKIQMSDDLIQKLSTEMNLNGRDIKQLLKLTVRYLERKKKALDFEAFRICAMFRGYI